MKTLSDPTTYCNCKASRSNPPSANFLGHFRLSNKSGQRLNSIRSHTPCRSSLDLAPLSATGLKTGTALLDLESFMALKSQHIVWKLEWVWLHSCSRTYLNHTHAIASSLNNGQGAFQIMRLSIVCPTVRAVPRAYVGI